MKKYKTLLLLFWFMVLLFITYNITSHVLTNKDGLLRHSLFYTEKHDVDVLFFGSSHTECSISPLLLWDRYGITSYNMGNSGERIPVTYWIIKDSIERKKPKMIFLDMCMICAGYDIEYNSASKELARLSIDSLPISSNKIDAINDLFPDTSIEKKLEYLVGFGVYHSRWKDLKKKDFRPQIRLDNGSISYEYEAMLTINPSQSPLYDSVVNELEPQEINLQYLNRIMELCKTSEIKLVLVYFPFEETPYDSASKQYIKSYSQLNNIEYIDIGKEMNNLNWFTDFFSNGHTNLLGKNKITDYIGDYIYDYGIIEDKRDNPEYQDWNYRFQEFCLEMKNTIINRDDLDEYFYTLVQ